MPKTSSLSFVYVDPTDDGSPAEKGKITLTVETDCEIPHEILQDIDFEQKLNQFLAEHFVTEAGRVVPLNVAEAFKTA